MTDKETEHLQLNGWKRLSIVFGEWQQLDRRILLLSASPAAHIESTGNWSLCRDKLWEKTGAP
jgi:hypothetical protein